MNISTKYLTHSKALYKCIEPFTVISDNVLDMPIHVGEIFELRFSSTHYVCLSNHSKRDLYIGHRMFDKYFVEVEHD